MTTIPPMTHELGRHWEQPAASDMLIDDEVAVMYPAVMAKLKEYSTTIPSGKYAGKMWKAKTADGWYLRWYEDDPSDPNGLFIRKRKIVLI
jgi:hypothetical protein